MAKAVFTACLVAVSLVWALGAQSVLAAEMRSYVVEGSKAAGLDACVEPTERMRRKHMEFIKHQRISVVHQGIRTSKYSLAGCVDCHIAADQQQTPIPINREDQFCGACHAFAAVDLNCFDCHAAIPNGPMASLAAEHAHRAVGLLGESGAHAEGATQ